MIAAVQGPKLATIGESAWTDCALTRLEDST